MALKVCVALTAPAAMAARVSAAVAFEWPSETRNPARRSVRGQLDGSRQLRRQRHQPDAAFGSLKEPVKGGDVGRKQMLRRLHAALGVREKRAFQMNADRPCLARNRRPRQRVLPARRATAASYRAAR